VLGIILFSLIAAIAVRKLIASYDARLPPQEWIVVRQPLLFAYLISAVIFVALFDLGRRRLNDHLKVNISVVTITVVIAVYAFETVLEFSPKPDDHKFQRIGTPPPPDTRSKFEVLEDLVISGARVFPNYYPALFNHLGNQEEANYIFPLGGISKSAVLFMNELGYYPVIETDEYGFNNPRGLYVFHDIDIMLIGDSFTAGHSVHANESIGSNLRNFDLTAISLGKGGNGPLIEFATLREYAKPFEPTVVLWLYSGNDVFNIKDEMNLPILMKYLNEKDFLQNLIVRQDEIDNLLIDFVSDEWEKERVKHDSAVAIELEEEKRYQIRRSHNKVSIRNFKIIGVLFNIRSKIGLLGQRFEETKIENSVIKSSGPIPDIEIINGIFKRTLDQSRKIVSEWGGVLYFVYIPMWESYSEEFLSENNEHMSRDPVLKVIDKLDIPIIDMHEKVFVPHPDPLSLFPFRTSGHYTAEGYRLVSEAIAEKLKADGVLQ
jgi:hypothetical protein